MSKPMINANTGSIRKIAVRPHWQRARIVGNFRTRSEPFRLENRELRWQLGIMVKAGALICQG